MAKVRDAMRTHLGAPSAVIGLLVLAHTSVATASQTAVDSGAGAQRALVDRYCVSCHNPRNQANAGRLDLTAVDFSEPGQHVEIFEKVVAKLRAGLMPPPGRRRPDPADRSKLIAYLETELDRVAEAAPNPGRTEPFHRLNRAEYRNAVRDLLGLDLDLTSFLPSDDPSFGFDNIAGVLKISQSRLEQYLAVARKISRAAIGSSLPVPALYEYRVADTLNQYDRLEGLPFGTRGGLLARHYFPQDGEYELSIELLCRVGGECDGSVGFPDEHRLLLLVDGELVESFTLEPRRGNDRRPPAERIWRVRLPVEAGSHDIAATFEKLPSIHEIDSAYQRFLRPYYLNGVIGAPGQTTYQPFVDAVMVVGPFDATGPGHTPSRQRIFVCDPQPGQELSCAKTIIRTLARRAYRRPVTDEELEPLLGVYRGNGQRGFENGIEAALQALLVSPEFLYRVERDPSSLPPGTNYRITDLELASRLSFFLWSSIPDEPLLAAAERGELKNPAVLEQHARRMLEDPRADALIENFTGQWLLLRNLDAHRPDLPLFPNFDDSLRAAARRETELLFGTILRENRPVLELLTADYTFLNERLARHYGVPQIYGSEFRRVSMPDERRRGLLGHASILTVTSRPNRTSPVLRGKWILENILGTPPPDPPANVPPLEENDDSNVSRLGVRERMARHRANPVCAACHSMIDPPGFALENFDAVGKWRTRDDALKPIDASGALPDGTKFDGLDAFREALLKEPEVFATTVTRKLMIYGLGRGLEAYDMPEVRRVVRDARPGGLATSELVLGIIKSVPFQMRRTPGVSQVSQ